MAPPLFVEDAHESRSDRSAVSHHDRIESAVRASFEAFKQLPPPRRGGQTKNSVAVIM